MIDLDEYRRTVERALREEAVRFARMSDSELDQAAAARAESDTICPVPSMAAALVRQVEFRKQWVRERAAEGRRLMGTREVSR